MADTAPDKDLESYWGVIFPTTKRHKNINIYYNDTYYQFFIAKYQTCLTNNGSCCNFLSKLTIQNVSLEYNATTISCIQYLKDEEINREKNATLSKQNFILRYNKNLHHIIFLIYSCVYYS